jgi:hypothetical protein
MPSDLNRAYPRHPRLNLSVVPDRLDRTTTHRLVTKHPLFLSLRLLVNKRVVVLVAPCEVIRRGVAANIAIDARRVHVILTADVLFYFFVLIRHADLKSGMRHFFRLHQAIELFTREKSQLDN